MKRRLSSGLIVIAVMSLGSVVWAQGPGSHAERQGEFGRGNSVLVDTSYVASDGCQAILSMRRGTPDGASVHFRTLPVTAVIGPDPAGCSGQRVLRRVFPTAGSLMHDLVEIFFVSPEGRILATERVALAPG